MTVPVTDRGDAVGLLGLLLPATPDKDVLNAAGQAAHVLAYVVIANGVIHRPVHLGRTLPTAHLGGGDPVPVPEGSGWRDVRRPELS
ncbi:putative magnesium or manganese-dependent protein phosphatase [Streptomyces lincolnensis]|uniref:Putative magnesium or manganese-dependent protein phosphatase n=1 Tax=Streptomyces lincolnensis TaxID=1915 RepID=A0A1B1M2I3_STRLN|nr:hypothetical protein [Streptomyces lincolnensis]ANS62850.1 putative magnesium or manganese-dependent protein phosphatase [Streptomyces lincolnensis]AXG51774.1 putative magnesium or manganese-dependent protein phosphatase [Streptomyces lincolnensis]